MSFFSRRQQQQQQQPQEQQQEYDESVFFPADNVGRYMITVKVMSADASCMVPVNCMQPVEMASVTGDSRLYWKEDGQLKFGTIQELFERYIISTTKEAFEVHSIRRKPGLAESRNKFNKKILTCHNIESSFEKIQGIYYHDIKPTWRVTLTNGKSVEITKDHSLFCADDYNRQLESKDLEHLDHIVSIDGYDIDSAVKTSFDEETLTFMGLWMADGSYLFKNKEDPYAIRISTGNDPKVIDWLESMSYSNKPDFLFSNNTTGLTCLHMQKNGDLSINNRFLAMIVTDAFGCSANSHTKRVPEFIFTATDDEICHFLKGYFTGDGSVHLRSSNTAKYYVVDCSSVNLELLHDVSVLLDRLGIKHTISEGYKIGKTGFNSKSLFYKLTIESAKSVIKFMEKIGFIKDRKYVVVNRWVKDSKNISRRGIRKLEYLGDRPVYDISVEESQAFVTNGILSHNSDPGADMLLVTKEVADMLGYNVDLISENANFFVQGKSGEPTTFKEIQTWIQLGNMRPLSVPIGLAVDDEGLIENLFGNKGTLDSGRIYAIYNEAGVTYRDALHGSGKPEGGTLAAFWR